MADAVVVQAQRVLRLRRVRQVSNRRRVADAAVVAGVAVVVARGGRRCLRNSTRSSTSCLGEAT